MPGLLDMFDSSDPAQQQGLLAAAAQVLQASGPSLMPHSFGQVMGAGLGGFQQGQAQAQALQQAKLKMMLEQAQVQQALRQGAALQPVYDKIGQHFAGGTQAPATAAMSPAAPQQSLPMGSVDPDGRTISTPGFFAPADVAQQPSSSPSSGAAQSGSGMFGLNDDALMGGALAGPGELGKAIIAANAPTDFAKSLAQAGIKPGTPLFDQLMQAQVAKQNYVAPVNARPGSILRDPFNPSKVLAFNPQIPAGSLPTFGSDGNVTGVSAIPGAADVEQTMSRAHAAGPASVKPTTGYDKYGNPVFISELDAATGGTGSSGAPRLGTQREPMPGQPGFDVTHMSPTQKQAFYKQAETQFGLRPGSSTNTSVVRPGLAPGVSDSIAGNVKTMNDDFADLYSANKQAPVTLALLDNIKKLAPTAITGNSADKLAYINGLLTLGGFQKQKDLATATDLLNKNANMLAINMRLGAGGGGSDALQALAQAANPNSHMQPEAIAKAADEVAGQVRMRQAQYQQLLPFKMSNDVQGYYGAQQKFVSQADPRNYQPGAQQAAPAQGTPAQAGPAAGQKFDMLPPAAQLAGRRMRADNGTVYRSDGTKWIKE